MSKQIIRTPWGNVIDTIEYDKDLVFYQTINGRCYQLEENYNKLVAKQFRIKGGWYGSDEDVAMIEYLFFPIIQGKGNYSSTRENIKPYMHVGFNFAFYEELITKKLHNVGEFLEWLEVYIGDADEWMKHDNNRSELEHFKKKQLNGTLDEWEFEKFYFSITN